MSQSLKYQPFINGLRAVAVVPVILFHFGSGVFSGGYAGVDVFFVISGYLITGVLMGMLEKKNFSLATFYERRARRILPALFATCALCLVYCWVYLMPDDFNLFGRSLIGAALFGTNFTFLQDVGYFARPALTKPLLHTWSLAVEEQFYVFYPLILLGLFKWAHRNRKRLVLGVTALFVASLISNLVLITLKPDATFYLLPTRAWELLAGALTFLYLQNIRLRGTVAESAALAGAALLAFSYLFYDRGTLFPGAAAIAPVLGTVLLIWPNLNAKTLVGRALSWKPMVGVGLISYALYLYHWPILVFGRYYLERELTGGETAFALAVIAAMASASYFVIEQPVREGRVFSSRRSIFVFSAAGLLAIGLMGVAATKMHGIPQRFSGQVLAYVTDDPLPAISCTLAGKDYGDRAQLCTIGDTHRAKTDFLLWGDSHADKITPGLNAEALEHHEKGVSIWSHGCLPLLGLEREQEKYRCRKLNARVMQYIRDENIKSVVLVSRWDLILQPEPDGVENDHAPAAHRVSLDTPDGELYDVPAFARALQDTLDQFKALGVHVWIVRQVPPHLQYISSSLGKYAYLGRDASVLNRPVSEVLKRRAPVDGVFDAVHEPNVSFIDPLNKFCPDGKTCIVAANGRSLYLDDTHVSAYGAVWAKGIWAAFFQGHGAESR